MDTSGDGKISLEEFKAFSKNQDAKLTDIFERFDATQTGFINALDIKVALHSIGQECDDDVV